VSLHDQALERLRRNLAMADTAPKEPLLNDTLRLLVKWRSQLLANTLLSLDGTTVQTGPFAGMDYLNYATEGALVARLLGCYESELHPHFLAFAREGLERIVDIGCAEGYYAVGLARLMPQVQVHAFDISEAARSACEALARKNGVADRVSVAGEFRGEDFARFQGRTLVLVDIEGAELDLLDPGIYPALRTLPIIVETHPGFRKDATEILTQRFQPSHHVQRVDHAPAAPAMPKWMDQTNHLDLILALWEWRNAPTPWLVMRPKA